MNSTPAILLSFCLLGQIAQAQVLQLQPLASFGPNGNGSILPGQLPYLTDGSTNSFSGSNGKHELQRSMAYNPTTGHLLVLSRTNILTGDSSYVGIINATDGTDTGTTLDLGIPGVGADDGYDFNLIAVAADGAIYVCDLSSKTTTSGAFNLYHYANESSSQDYVYSGDPGNGSPNSAGRWGDTLTVTGTGTDTRVLVSSRGNVMAILTPTDPTLTQPWTATTLQATVPIGSIGYGLAFGASSNTILAKSVVGPLYLFNYSYTNGVGGIATNIETYPTTAFPGWTGAIGIQPNSNLLAGLEMPPGMAANVRLYDVTSTANPPVLLDRQAWVTNEAGNGIYAGSIFMAGTNLYALDSDNGIMAFSIFSGPQPSVAPALILQPTSQAAYFQGNTAFTGAADGIPTPAYQWYFNTNTVIANSATFGGATTTTLTVSNIVPANLGQYQFIATNSSGSVTSSVAILSQAVAFQNGVVYEPFNYPVGIPLFGLGGWVTNTASAAAQVAGCYLAAGNLSVPGLAAAIGNHYLWASNVTVRLPFGTQTNGPLYFSFSHRGTNLAANTATEDPIGGPAYYSGTTLYPKVDCVWTDSNHYSVGVAKGTGTGYRITDTQVFTGTDTVFIVCCLVMTNGNTGSDIAELWVNPDPATYGAASPPVPNCATNTGNGGATADPANGVDRFSWRGTAGSFQHEVDELRIGFTWAAVTPPPPVYLAASVSGNSVLVSWPTNATGYTLTGKNNLSDAIWTTNAPIVVQGTNNTFTVTGPTGHQLFRLTK